MKAIDAKRYRAKLNDKLQAAIMEAGKIAGSGAVFVDNGAVVDTLLDLVALYTAMSKLENHTPEQLVAKYGQRILRDIPLYRHALATRPPMVIVEERDMH